jgi:hypothetical protein
MAHTASTSEVAGMNQQQLSEQLESARIARRALRRAYLEAAESERNCRREAGLEPTIEDLAVEYEIARLGTIDAHHAEVMSERHDTASITESCARHNRAWERYEAAKRDYFASIVARNDARARARIMGRSGIKSDSTRADDEFWADWIKYSSDPQLPDAVDDPPPIDEPAKDLPTLIDVDELADDLESLRMIAEKARLDAADALIRECPIRAWEAVQRLARAVISFSEDWS